MPTDIAQLADLAAKLAPLLSGGLKLPGERVLELSLEVASKILDLVSDLPIEVRQEYARWVLEDQKRLRQFFGIEKSE